MLNEEIIILTTTKFSIKIFDLSWLKIGRKYLGLDRQGAAHIERIVRWREQLTASFSLDKNKKNAELLYKTFIL